MLKMQSRGDSGFGSAGRTSSGGNRILGPAAGGGRDTSPLLLHHPEVFWAKHLRRVAPS